MPSLNRIRNNDSHIFYWWPGNNFFVVFFRLFTHLMRGKEESNNGSLVARGTCKSKTDNGEKKFTFPRTDSSSKHQTTPKCAKCDRQFTRAGNSGTQTCSTFLGLRQHERLQHLTQYQNDLESHLPEPGRKSIVHWPKRPPFQQARNSWSVSLELSTFLKTK